MLGSFAVLDLALRQHGAKWKPSGLSSCGQSPLNSSSLTWVSVCSGIIKPVVNASINGMQCLIVKSTPPSGTRLSVGIALYQSGAVRRAGSGFGRVS